VISRKCSGLVREGTAVKYAAIADWADEKQYSVRIHRAAFCDRSRIIVDLRLLGDCIQACEDRRSVRLFDCGCPVEAAVLGSGLVRRYVVGLVGARRRAGWPMLVPMVSVGAGARSAAGLRGLAGPEC
jgi:hypothetical protein